VESSGNLGLCDTEQRICGEHALSRSYNGQPLLGVVYSVALFVSLFYLKVILICAAPNY
jgi:hypothetical protein